MRAAGIELSTRSRLRTPMCQNLNKFTSFCTLKFIDCIYRPKGSKFGVTGGRFSRFGVLGLYTSNVFLCFVSPRWSPRIVCGSGLAPNEVYGSMCVEEL
jgi:hypothetical protein